MVAWLQEKFDAGWRKTDIIFRFGVDKSIKLNYCDFCSDFFYLFID